MCALKDPECHSPENDVIFHVHNWKCLLQKINANTHLHRCSWLSGPFTLTANVILAGLFGI